jgi:hypothetical protein
MRILFSLIICCAMLCSAQVRAEDYTGVWKGTLTTTVNGKETRLPFKIFIQARGNGSFNGITELHMTIKGQDYRYECRLMGSIIDEGFRFRDGEVRTSTGPKDDPKFHWCIKSGVLKMGKNSDGGRTLSGDITGYSDVGDCAPGHADLVWMAKDE